MIIDYHIDNDFCQDRIVHNYIDLFVISQFCELIHDDKDEVINLSFLVYGNRQVSNKIHS